MIRHFNNNQMTFTWAMARHANHKYYKDMCCKGAVNVHVQEFCFLQDKRIVCKVMLSAYNVYEPYYLLTVIYF